ncbi:MAG TPA: arsenate reductase ArsC [Saprospiraceae bacterium]|nr:arsenate reductase ArsC [Saprospiraceae bacterium]
MSRSILILCTGNSCRSQMAEGYLRKYLPDDQIYSAGIEAHGLNPLAVKVMAEVGIDISHHSSKLIDALPHIAWDIVITVCDNAREQCPVLPGKHLKFHHSFNDPATAKGVEEEVLPVYRRVRDAIQEYTARFAQEHKL